MGPEGCGVMFEEGARETKFGAVSPVLRRSTSRPCDLRAEKMKKQDELQKSPERASGDWHRGLF